jgi:hypothetical protein
VAALLLIVTVIASMAYDRLIAAPQREHIVRRYNEFRDVVASGDNARIMQFVAPEFRPWAENRLHLYRYFARPLDHRSTVSYSFGSAAICPEPRQRFLIVFGGGHVIKMARHNGEWFLGRVFID